MAKNTETRDRIAMERKWQAEDDARIMAQYQEIMNDKARMSRATKEATRQARETEPQYIPYPSTWLNGYRWQDSTDTAPTANSTEGYSKAYADEFGV